MDEYEALRVEIEALKSDAAQPGGRKKNKA
jgi:hypothetical protein